MSLPTDFKSIIEEEYSNYGWELACCFSFVAEYLGYKVLDISAVETALKMIATTNGSSLKNYENHYPKVLDSYVKSNYCAIHNAFTRRGKSIKISDEENELDRQDKVLEKFIKYIMKNDTRLYSIHYFYKEYIKTTLKYNIESIFIDIEEKINQEITDEETIDEKTIENKNINVKKNKK
ncbi:MAG: hypothetical protein HC907_24250 [Richelia sp. SM1_7_0]|nr:hypothetical protein [Richelia sp. SM1_7_0]